MWKYVNVCESAHRGQKSMLDSLELELYTVAKLLIEVLRPELESSIRTTQALNYGAITTHG